MALIIKDNSASKDYPLPDTGLVRGVCVDTYDKGTEQTPWGPKEKVMVVWEIDQPHPEFDGPFRVNKKYTASLNEKANLCQDLESWRGRAFTDEEREGFDIEKLIGVPCMLNIVHNVDKQGRTWANVKAVLPMQRGAEPIKPSGHYTRVKDREDDDRPAQRQQGGGKKLAPKQAAGDFDPADSSSWNGDDDLPF